MANRAVRPGVVPGVEFGFWLAHHGLVLAAGALRIAFAFHNFPLSHQGGQHGCRSLRQPARAEPVLCARQDPYQHRGRFQKLQLAWSLIREQGAREHLHLHRARAAMPLAAEDLEFADDEIGPALSFDRLKALALEHLGGIARERRHRRVQPPDRRDDGDAPDAGQARRCGDRRVGNPQPSLGGARRRPGRRRFIDTAGLAAFRDAIASEKPVARRADPAAVTYDLMPLDAIRTVVRLAHDKGAMVYVDDAGGARVGPAASISRGRWSSASISAPPGSTNTAPRGRASACSPAARTWSAASAPRGSSSAGGAAGALSGGGADARTIRSGPRAGADRHDEADRRRVAAAARQPVARDADDRTDSGG